MDESRQPNRPIEWRLQLPWLHLFRAFRIAIDPRKLLLGGLALICLTVGNALIGRMPFAPSTALTEITWPSDQPIDGLFSYPTQLEPDVRLSEIEQSYPDILKVIVQPVANFIEPLLLLLRPQLEWSIAAYAITKLLWNLLVWSLFGGAITRIAAARFARDETVGLIAALRFAAGRLLSYFTAPILPLAGIAVFWLLCLGGGLFGRIPVVGEIVLGAFWVLALICGLLMALIMVGLAAGWPLMFATISTEGSDAFDGLSRSYSYVYDRPWQYLWYLVVAMAYGSVLVLVVSTFFGLSTYLAGWAVAGGLGHKGMTGLLLAAPENVAGAEAWYSAPKAAPTVGSVLASMWLHATGLLRTGFVYSYFWTAMTIIYFLLRKSVDATDFVEIYQPEQAEEDDLLPLVGVAESEQPVIERPSPQVPETDD
jgi:hypothetical protein